MSRRSLQCEDVGTPDAIDFITMDGIADTASLVEAFGLRLTPIEEGLATYLGKK